MVCNFYLENAFDFIPRTESTKEGFPLFDRKKIDNQIRLTQETLLNIKPIQYNFYLKEKNKTLFC